MESANNNNYNASAPGNPVASNLSAGVVLHIIKRHWVMGLAFGLLASMGFAFFLYQQDPIYEADSSLLFELRADRVISMDDVVDNTIEGNRLETAMNTHRERIFSKDFAQNVLNGFTPEQQERIIKPFRSVDPVTNEAPDNADILRNNVIDLEHIPQSQVFYITAAHPDPEVAAKIANAYATNYINYMLDERSSSTKRAASFLQQQADELRAEIRQSEEQLQQYRAKHGITASEEDDDVVANRLVRINDEVTEERVKIISLRSTLRQINQAEGDRNSLLAIEQIYGQEPIPSLAADLERIRNKRKVLSETYLRKHPKMKDIVAEEDATLRSIDENITKAKSAIERSLANAEQREEKLMGELEAIEGEANNLDKLAIEYNVLKRRLDTRKKTLDELSTRLNETLVANQLQNTNVEVLSVAKPPVLPANPNFAKVAGASALLFLITFITVPLVREYWDGRLKTFAEIEAYVGKPVLGHMRKTRHVRNKTIAKQRKNAELVENFRSLFAQLSLNGDRKPPMTCMITSTDAGEGKSFVSSHLAITCARHGLHTLLIDADLRRPSLHKQFELENDLGIIPWFEKSGRADKIELLDITNVTGNLHLIRSGGATNASTEILQSVAFQKLVENLKASYDVIIIDTPPFGPCPDCQFMARYCDFSLYTVRQNHVPRRKVRSAIQRLDRTSAPVLGVVLNQIIGQSADSPYASFESEYGSTYGYGADYYPTATSSPAVEEEWSTNKSESAKEKAKV